MINAEPEAPSALCCPHCGRADGLESEVEPAAAPAAPGIGWPAWGAIIGIGILCLALAAYGLPWVIYGLNLSDEFDGPGTRGLYTLLGLPMLVPLMIFLIVILRNAPGWVARSSRQPAAGGAGPQAGAAPVRRYYCEHCNELVDPVSGQTLVRL